MNSATVSSTRVRSVRDGPHMRLGGCAGVGAGPRLGREQRTGQVPLVFHALRSAAIRGQRNALDTPV